MNRTTPTVLSSLLLLPALALSQPLPAFTVRDGFKLSAATDKLPEARFIELDDKGTLYVSQPRAGAILALTDKDKDGHYETSATFIKGKPQSHGMHFHNGWLYFSQSKALHKAKDTNNDGVADEVVTILPDLPGGTGHWWRSILVTDDAIYTSVGDSGNATDEVETDRQKIWKYDLEGKNKKLFASGIRNTEKLRIRPGTTEIWGLDHNSDHYGRELGEKPPTNQPFTDTFPPEEFNLYVEGAFYGHPFLVGPRVPRIEFILDEQKDDSKKDEKAKKRPPLLELAAKSVVPEWSFGAHWAGNGWCWITKDQSMKGDAFAAFHGSWNSSTKVGYRVERILFDSTTGKPYGSQPIVTTLKDGQVLARPVDCTEAPDGSILWSCDHTQRVYRLTHSQ